MPSDYSDNETIEIVKSLVEKWDVMDSDERQMGLKLARKILEMSRQEYFMIRGLIQSLEDKIRQDTLTDTDFE